MTNNSDDEKRKLPRKFQSSNPLPELAAAIKQFQSSNPLPKIAAAIKQFQSSNPFSKLAAAAKQLQSSNPLSELAAAIKQFQSSNPLPELAAAIKQFQSLKLPPELVAAIKQLQSFKLSPEVAEAIRQFQSLKPLPELAAAIQQSLKPLPELAAALKQSKSVFATYSEQMRSAIEPLSQLVVTQEQLRTLAGQSTNFSAALSVAAAGGQFPTFLVAEQMIAERAVVSARAEGRLSDLVGKSLTVDVASAADKFSEGPLPSFLDFLERLFSLIRSYVRMRKV